MTRILNSKKKMGKIKTDSSFKPPLPRTDKN